jgi:hypothetical protein
MSSLALTVEWIGVSVDLAAQQWYAFSPSNSEGSYSAIFVVAGAVTVISPQRPDTSFGVFGTLNVQQHG